MSLLPQFAHKLAESPSTAVQLITTEMKTREIQLVDGGVVGGRSVVLGGDHGDDAYAVRRKSQDGVELS